MIKSLCFYALVLQVTECVIGNYFLSRVCIAEFDGHFNFVSSLLLSITRNSLALRQQSRLNEGHVVDKRNLDW